MHFVGHDHDHDQIMWSPKGIDLMTDKPLNYTVHNYQIWTNKFPWWDGGGGGAYIKFSFDIELYSVSVEVKKKFSKQCLHGHFGPTQELKPMSVPRNMNLILVEGLKKIK